MYKKLFELVKLKLSAFRDRLYSQASLLCGGVAISLVFSLLVNSNDTTYRYVELPCGCWQAIPVTEAKDIGYKLVLAFVFFVASVVFKEKK